MKIVKLAIIAALLAWLPVVGFGAYRVYQSFSGFSGVLRAEKTALESAKLERLTEQERQKSEQERRKTAVLMARLRRQERLENSQAVSLSAVVLASFLRLFPVLLFGGASIGGLVYTLTKKVPVKTPFVETVLPVRKAAAIVERSLQVSNSAEMARCLAFSDDVTEARMNSAANLYKSLKGHTGRENMQSQALPEHVEPQATQDAGNVSFQQAVNQFRPGNVLIGYDSAGNAVYFALKDFVSCAFGGGSGSGKTSKLRFLCAQMALQGVNLSILDAHQGNEQSLVDSLGNLASLPNVRIFPAFETAVAVATMLSEVQAAIQAGKPADTPSVFILDELRPLNRACSDVENLMDILSNEGRKFNQFGVFASQTWEAKMFKQAGSSARDACVLKMAARMPKEQARILFKDGDSARQVAKLARPEMFADSAAFSGVVTVPFCSKDDLNSLVPNVSQKTPSISLQVNAGRDEEPEPIKETNDAQNVSENVSENVSNVRPFPTMKRHETPTERAETDTPTMSETEVRAFFNAKIERNEESLSGLAAQIGVNKGGFYRFLKNNEHPSESMQERFTAFLAAFRDER